MRSLKYRRDFEHEAQVRALYERNEMPLGSVPHTFVGRDGAGNERLRAFVSREEWTPGDTRWHVSITTQTRVPSWDEIANALHELRPGVPFVLGVPPRSWWMNVHENCLHAWETKDQGLIDQWRAERQGHTPT